MMLFMVVKMMTIMMLLTGSLEMIQTMWNCTGGGHMICFLVRQGEYLGEVKRYHALYSALPLWQLAKVIGSFVGSGIFGL